MAKKSLPSFNELVDERCEPFQGDVQIDFVMRHKILKYSVKKACEEVGISNVYGHKINRMWATDPKFRSRIMKKLDKYPDDYKDACKALLPTILKTEVKGLEAMADDPTLAVKHPQLLKQMKMGAGVDLSDNPPSVVQHVNIEFMQQLICDTIGAVDSTDSDIIDADVEEQKVIK